MRIPPTLLEALEESADALERLGISHALVGGLAFSVWGVVRGTIDVDFAVELPGGSVEALVERLKGSFRLPPDPVGMGTRCRFLPAWTSKGVRVDFMFADFDFQRHTVERSRRVSVFGRSIHVCRPEDLLLYKIVSDRGRDREDVAAILVRRLSELDLAYVEGELHKLAAIFEEDKPLVEWRAAVEAARAIRSHPDFQPTGDFGPEPGPIDPTS